MGKEKDMSKYRLINYSELNKSEELDEYLINECLNVANNANFPTDYLDVKEHLFGNPNLIKLFIVDMEERKIKGFLAADNFIGYNDNNILHCHGIIVDPEIQSLGYSKVLVNELVKQYNPDIVTAKTHNPRCFNAFTNIDNVISYYPNSNEEIPEVIYEVVKTDPYICDVNSNLIYEEAYPDEKISQDYRDESLKKIFDKLNPNDAQAIVVVLNDQKLINRNKQFIKK